MTAGVRCLCMLASGMFVPGMVGCSSGSGKVVIRVEGSDTMVNLAQAWAEEYHKIHPDVQVQVSGGGSQVGISSLIIGQCELANASRRMKAKELRIAEKKTGRAPVEFIVGRDALAVYVHVENPIEAIAIEELAEIYGEGGTVTAWSQIAVANTACSSNAITCVSRQSNSGTYVYFRQAVLGKQRDFKDGSIQLSGSKDVVALVATTPCAIGYSGMGYATDDVKTVPVAPSKGAPAVAPTVENCQNGTYPIARPLFIYTLGEPTGAVKDYLDWIMSAAGQEIVRKKGYVPVTE